MTCNWFGVSAVATAPRGPTHGFLLFPGLEQERMCNTFIAMSRINRFDAVVTIFSGNHI